MLLSIIVKIKDGLFNMIYVHPVGGLGNMFFHIASIYALAKDNGDELCLLNISNKINSLKNDERIDLKHADQYMYFLNRFKEKIGDVNKVNYPFEFVKLQYLKEHEYVGYFQSENYFKHRRNDILKIFEPSDEILNKVNKYKNIFGEISLHVRRGDFAVRYNGVHPVQPIDYYSNALKLLPSNNKIIVFSDDLDWCKKNFIGDRYVFIDEIDYISIYVMSNMRHHIIANSSFSWWGAWLSEYDDKKIIAPKNWFGGRKKGLDIKMKIVPENWIRL
jgi:hypothetical protein